MSWLRAVLLAYGRVVFAGDLVTSALVASATFVAPAVGVGGLVGAAVATGVARLLELDGDAVRGGVWGYNGLLVGLVLAAHFVLGPAVFGLIGLGALVAVGVQLGLGGWLRNQLGVPVLSLPFVAATWLVGSTAPFVVGVVPREFPAADTSILAPLGALFASPTVVSGALVLLALLRWSRIGALHALVGLAVARLLALALVDLPLGADATTLGFNAAFTAVALGGVYVVAEARSLVLAAFGALLAALVTLASARPLTALGLAPLALPLGLVVPATLYAFAWRGADARPRLAPVPGRTPEETVHQVQTRRRRFGVRVPVRLRLPFHGTWTCTQGNDGPHTHRELWRHGLDFEVLGEDGRAFTGAGAKLTDWRCYGLPVVAMAPGTVVEVVDGLPDNPPGSVDTTNPWGNLVIVQHAVGVYGVVAHLQPRSVRVRKGDVVSVGQELGRCGSSGRSPTPHLHVQLQPTATVGDRTLPIAFHGVGFGDEVRAEACPAEGDRVGNVVVDGALARALGWNAGRTIELTVRDGDRVTKETVASEVDLYGGRTLRSGDARLWFESRDDTFVVYDADARPGTALHVLLCGLSRVPLSSVPVGWTDALDARRLRGGVRVLDDLLAAVRPPPVVTVRRKLVPDGEGTRIEGEADGWSTTAILRRAGGGTISWRAGGRTVEVSW